MRPFHSLWFKAIFSLLPFSSLAGAMVEGTVELPKSHGSPVIANRYDIVTRGGVLSTELPLAAIYLEGAFPRSTSAATRQVAQNDLTFIRSLVPVQVGTKVEFPNLDDTYHSISLTRRRSASNSAATDRRSDRSRRSFSTNWGGASK